MPNQPQFVFDIRTVDYIEDSRFSFVRNEQLRTDLSIAAQYIDFMFKISNEYEVPGPVKYSLYKTIVIYSASITEGLLCYALKDILELKTSTKKDYKDIKEICKLENGDRIVWCREKTVSKRWKDVDFRSLNGRSKSNDVLNSELYEKCEDLRDKRNKIHIAHLSQGEDQFSIEEINEIFETLAAVIKSVKTLH